MYEKEKELIDAFLHKKIDRRELIGGLSLLGVSGALAGQLLNRFSTQALAADFDWKRHAKTKINLLLNKHPYSDAMIADLAHFTELTEIEVLYDIFPEDVYFDKVTAALSSNSPEYDVFMTGAYMSWTYGPANWIEDLNCWIRDPARTNPAFQWDDMIEGVRKSCAWNGVAGAPLGTQDAKQWCLPWAYEQNNISYNKIIFEKAGVSPPNNMNELIEVAAKISRNMPGICGIGVRGSRSWATIHAGFLSAYANFNQRDLTVSVDGKLRAAMNSSGSKSFHYDWVRMIQESGPKDWSTYTWYQVATDLGTGASAMIFDADMVGYLMNGGLNKEAGHMGYKAFAANPDALAPTPNIWIWCLAMSRFSQYKDAAWYFMQWASGPEHTLFGASQMDFVNPVRTSTWQDTVFRSKLDEYYQGYAQMHDRSSPGASIKFTPQPLFFDLTTNWAAALQKMVAKEVPIDEGLDILAENINNILEEAGL